MKPQVSELWLEMALDAVEAARDRMLVHEFDRRAKLMPIADGMGYVDRTRVLDDLIQTQVIGVDERRLTLGKIEGAEWIAWKMESGSEIAWRIAEILDRRGHVVRKFEADRLKEIGLIGERAVIEHLSETVSESIQDQIRHVSLHDDGLGYDIVSPSVSGRESMQLLEVKTSVRPGKMFSLFLSRNEFRVGATNPNWNIVCVRIVDGFPCILGYFSIRDMVDRFPKETDLDIEWASCRMQVSCDSLSDGLP